MKALSVKQPFAWLIIQGIKDVENRSWPTDLRGEVLIHAGWHFDDEGYQRVCEEMAITLPDKEEFLRGGIIGSVKITDCIRDGNSVWFEGPYGFMLAEPKPREFFPCRGKPKFFELEGNGIHYS